MRVLFVTGEYPPMRGGVGDQTASLAEALAKLGVESSVLTSIEAVGDSRTTEVSVLPVVSKWDWGLGGVLDEAVESRGIDIVHIQYQTAAYAMHPAINFIPMWRKRRGRKTTIVTTFHDLRFPYLFPKAGRRLRDWVTTALFAGSNAAITTNEEDYARLANTRTGGVLHFLMGSNGATRTGVHFVPLGNNLAAEPSPGIGLDDLRTRWGIGGGEIVLAYLGFLNDSKGVEYLLLALRSLVAAGRKVKLLMIGAETGDADPTNRIYRQRILTLVHDQGIENNVVWTGYLKPTEVSSHLMISDICVLPFRDGASFRRTTLITALAHGLPVVTTIGGDTRLDAVFLNAPRLVNEGNVMLVPVDDPAALETAIGGLADSPELRHSLGKNGRMLSQAFSWETVSARTLEVYESLF